MGMAETDAEQPALYKDLFRGRTKPASAFGHLLALAAVIPIGVTVAYTFRDVTDPVRLAVALILFAAFTALFLYFIYFADDRRMAWALIGETAVIICLSIVPGPRDGFLFIVYAILSAQIGITYKPRTAALWFLVIIAITVGSNVAVYGTGGLLTGLGNITGYFFFTLVGGLMREALLARERSEQLAKELRVANEQLVALGLQTQQLAVSEERNRMARELHDSLGHRLTVAVVQLEGAQRLMPTDPDRAGRIIGVMREQMKEALSDLRRTVATLRTPIEDDLPLTTAITRMAQSFEEGTGIRVDLRLPESLPNLSPAHRLALFRAAQESLTNAQRHGAARHVWLDVVVENRTIKLIARDDGKGLSAASMDDGFGLRGMRERAVHLGGTLELADHPDGGARMVFTLPIP